MKNYQELIADVKANENPQTLEALADWFETEGMMYCNGECFNTEKDLDGKNLYPIYQQDEDNYEIIGWELR